MSQKPSQQVVLDELITLGVPRALSEGILRILTEAGYESLAHGDPDTKQRRAELTKNIEVILPRILRQTTTIGSNYSVKRAQTKYRYAQWAVWQYKTLRRSHEQID